MRRTPAWALRSVKFTHDTAVFDGKTTKELLRTVFVFRLCAIKPLVENSRRLLSLSEKIIGRYLTYDVLVAPTFFAQFCAGTNQYDLQGSLKRLERAGVGAILDYAAEAPVDTAESAKARTASVLEVSMSALLCDRKIEYFPDDALDTNLTRCIQCINATSQNTGSNDVGYAAVKISGLCEPQLLARASALLLALRQIWLANFCLDDDAQIPPLEECRAIGETHSRVPIERFVHGLKKTAPSLTDAQIEECVAFFDRSKKGYVDYLRWTETVSDYLLFPGRAIPALTPLLSAAPRLTPVECKLMEATMRRLNYLVQHTCDLRNVRIMLDAEQTYYQMAIDYIVRVLQVEYNKTAPVIYNTYQAYLTHTEYRVDNDLRRSEREGWIWAGKLVRGAYLTQERSDALKMGYKSPIHDSLEETHAAYNRIALKLLDVAVTEEHRNIGILYGTHNPESLELLANRVYELHKEKKTIDVAFAQLYGMAEHLTIPLARAGYNVFKYVPYGPIKETMFYLQRRAEENREMLANADGEYAIAKEALMRRVFRRK